MLPESMWSQVKVPDEVKVRSHECILRNRQKIGHMGGWRCDKLKKFPTCFSNMTSFGQSHGIQGWRCNNCDFDLC